MARLVTEWVNVTRDVSIIARESGEVWFHTPGGAKEKVDPFATPMTGVGAAGSTVGLLDGAINLGFAAIEKVIGADQGDDIADDRRVRAR